MLQVNDTALLRASNPFDPSGQRKDRHAHHAQRLRVAAARHRAHALRQLIRAWISPRFPPFLPARTPH